MADAGGPSRCPVDHGSPQSCPVDHKSSSTWSLFTSPSGAPSSKPSQLSGERQVSSIPMLSEGNWVYPSETQFFTAMARKNHNPEASDMKTIVPIHNAVNERAWAEVLKWEAGKGGETCGGVKLVTFKGKANETSPKARWKMLLGYSAPFDRHDWIVDRCGTRVRYVIDFYTGRNSNSGPSFYLDVRPALDNWEGVKMRVQHFWQRSLGSVFTTSSSSSSSKK
ncbi:cytochrome c/c1 heme-lyase [Amanita rubescens]|nr:cytochrome c/c1 heme-lyase [Amanita rubescens]